MNPIPSPPNPPEQGHDPTPVSWYREAQEWHQLSVKWFADASAWWKTHIETQDQGARRVSAESEGSADE